MQWVFGLKGTVDLTACDCDGSGQAQIRRMVENPIWLRSTSVFLPKALSQGRALRAGAANKSIGNNMLKLLG